MFRLIILVFCLILASCSTSKESQRESSDEIDHEIKLDSWEEEMDGHPVYVIFDREYFYAFDLYIIPEYDTPIPYGHIEVEDVRSIEIIDIEKGDARVRNMGINSRRDVVFIEVEKVEEILKISPYMVKFLKSDILE